jgi:hypothetical protein
MVMKIFFGFIDDLFRFIDDTPAAVMNQSYIVQAAEGKRPDRVLIGRTIVQAAGRQASRPGF